MLCGGLHTLGSAEVRRKPCRVGQKARPRSKTRVFNFKEQEVRIAARWQAARSGCIGECNMRPALAKTFGSRGFVRRRMKRQWI